MDSGRLGGMPGSGGQPLRLQHVRRYRRNSAPPRLQAQGEFAIVLRHTMAFLGVDDCVATAAVSARWFDTLSEVGTARYGS